MGRSVLMLMFVYASSPAVCRAVVPCPAELEGVAPASIAAQRLFAAVAQAFGGHLTIAVSPGVSGVCLRGETLIFSPERLAPSETQGGPARAAAVGLLAWSVALRQAAIRDPLEERSMIAARMAGCALARLGVRGDAVVLQLGRIETAAQAIALPAMDRAVFDQGYRQCIGG